MKRIVIVGGGFAGINLVRKLAGNAYFHVTLVDRNNYNFFPPLLYQVATSFLEPANVSYPFRKLLRRNNNIHFRLGEFLKVNTQTHTCYLNNGELRYDYLVFATGAVSNYFGNENIRRNAIPMKTLNDALQMRNILLQTLEQASITTDETLRKKLLTIVVAGGGPTGVEVAGMLGELRRDILYKDYPELLQSAGEIYLVDGGSRLLAQMSEQSHQDALKALKRLGIKVLLKSPVTDFNNEEVVLAKTIIIKTKSLIWAAGIVVDTIEGLPTTSIGKGQRILTDACNSVAGVKDVYAIGDACLQTTDTHFPNGHPQLAQTAIQQGNHLAKNFINNAKGKPFTAFTYVDKGTMAVVGRNRAVVDIPRPRLHFKGIVALLMWLFIHLASLITQRNRMKTLYNWITIYLTNDQSLRMIFGPNKGSATA